MSLFDLDSVGTCEDTDDRPEWYEAAHVVVVVYLDPIVTAVSSQSVPVEISSEVAQDAVAAVPPPPETDGTFAAEYR